MPSAASAAARNRSTGPKCRARRTPADGRRGDHGAQPCQGELQRQLAQRLVAVVAVDRRHQHYRRPGDVDLLEPHPVGGGRRRGHHPTEVEQPGPVVRGADLLRRQQRRRGATGRRQQRAALVVDLGEEPRAARCGCSARPDVAG
ncbi:MAG: hypothetical protein PGN15_13130 [Aeromicrobium erythreum]